MTHRVNMDRRVLAVFLLLWSSGLWAEDTQGSTVVPDDVRLVGGAGPCAGRLEEKHRGVWRPVRDKMYEWNLMAAAAVCTKLNCGSAVLLRRTSADATVSLEHQIRIEKLEILCSDSVRLVNGTNLCSGRLEVKSNQLWSTVCEDDFDQQDAEVVCKELGCGAPLVLQGALYGEVEAPVWTKKFQCEGHESALLDCRSSVRNTCSSAKAVGLSCSDPGHFRLVGGASRCAGTLEIKKMDEWKTVDDWNWNLMMAGEVCEQLDCGPAVSTRRIEIDHRLNWGIIFVCNASSLMDCVIDRTFSYTIVWITCTDSVRLVSGRHMCSGRLEVKSDQLWSSVCEDDFNQQDAEVVCKELGCGAPTVLQGALYGEVEAPVWTKEFQCEGHESALLDCRSSVRNTCSSGKAAGLSCSDPGHFRLAEGASLCAGTVEIRYLGEWKTVAHWNWNLRLTSLVCGQLDCGSAVSTRGRVVPKRFNWEINRDCDTSLLMGCLSRKHSSVIVEITCSDSVRLVNGTNLCSGRLEVKSDQLWSSVCEDDFDQQDAEVVCKELGCGAPTVLQGALYGEVEAPVWTKEFQCEGHESALLDCRSSVRNTCSSGKAAGLSCSDPGHFRLAEGASLCSGTLEIRYLGEWKTVANWNWNLRLTSLVCGQLDCGSAVSTRGRIVPERFNWEIKRECDTSLLMECLSGKHSSVIVEITCSDSVRLVNGTNLCSGRLEVKSDQLWSSVCEDDFDQQDAEVVCKELGCGAPLVLKGALYGEVEAPVWTKEFQCEGHESALLDCRSPVPPRDTCSSGKAVGLICSDPDDVRLVGGASRCTGSLELKHHEDWKALVKDDFIWSLKEAEALCRWLDCGFPVSVEQEPYSFGRPVWKINPLCAWSEFTLRECVTTNIDSTSVKITCSGSVRLVDGNHMCSGRLEVKQSNQSNQLWSTVCEDDFDQQDAEVVCKELGCGAPTVLKGAVFGEVEASVWTKEFQCEGNESSLLDCGGSGSAVKPCSSSKAVGITCSAQPTISSTSSTDGASMVEQQRLQVLMGSRFTITCAIQPQYPGGFFHLISNTQIYILPAVNHSAHFLFSAADHTHQGEYSCGYYVTFFSNNFSSYSQPIVLTVSGSVTELIIRHVVGLLGLMSLIITVVCFHSKANRIQHRGRETNTEINDDGRSPEERVIMSTEGAEEDTCEAPDPNK